MRYIASFSMTFLACLFSIYVFSAINEWKDSDEDQDDESCVSTYPRIEYNLSDDDLRKLHNRY